MNVIAIMGCTASGKSSVAEVIAGRWRESRGVVATVMAVDSMQVYRGMDIGTSKPSEQVRRSLPHAMLDVADPWESYSAARFCDTAQNILDAHAAEGKRVIMVVGTILYFKALTQGLFAGPAAQPEIRRRLNQLADDAGTEALHRQLAAVDAVAAGRIHLNDRRRLIRALEVFEVTGRPISALQDQWRAERSAPDFPLIVIQRDRADLAHRINRRVEEMLERGLVEEVERLINHPQGLSMQAAQGVGYKEIIDYLHGRCSRDQAIEEIKINTRHLAKLQRTWLRRFAITATVDAGPTETAELQAQQIMDACEGWADRLASA